MDGSTKVKDIMRKKGPHLKKDDPLNKAVKVFLKEPDMVFPVVDSKGAFIGEIDQREMIRLALPQRTARDTNVLGPKGIKAAMSRFAETVGDLMTVHQNKISPDTTVEELAKVMVESGVKALQVIDKGGRNLGFVTEIDILMHIDKDLNKTKKARKAISKR